MSADSSPTFSSEYISEVQARILSQVHERPASQQAETGSQSQEQEASSGPLLDYIRDAYAARMETPNERAELSQMKRAARFVTISSGEAASADSQEFFCGELFATEFVAHLIGTRGGTGELAQMAMSGFFEIERPDGETPESRIELEKRHVELAYKLQEQLTNPGNVLPQDFEALLDTLVLEKEARTILNGELTSRSFDNSYPKFFAMGYRMIINEAIASGMIENAYLVQATMAQDPQKRATDKFYGKPQEETILDHTPVPSDAALEAIVQDSFESSDYFLISDTRDQLEKQHDFILARLRATLPKDMIFDDETLAIMRKKAGAVLTTYAAEKKLLTAGDLISSQGNQIVLVTESVEAVQAAIDANEEPNEVRHFFNSRHEIRGEYIGMDVIAMPPAATLKKWLKKDSPLEYDDPAHDVFFVPAMRLKNPTVTQQDEEGGFEGVYSIGEHIEILVPIIYSNVYLAKFLSSLPAESAPGGSTLEA